MVSTEDPTLGIIVRMSGFTCVAVVVVALAIISAQDAHSANFKSTLKGALEAKGFKVEFLSKAHLAELKALIAKTGLKLKSADFGIEASTSFIPGKLDLVVGLLPDGSECLVEVAQEKGGDDVKHVCIPASVEKRAKTALEVFLRFLQRLEKVLSSLIYFLPGN